MACWNSWDCIICIICGFFIISSCILRIWSSAPACTMPTSMYIYDWDPVGEQQLSALRVASLAVAVQHKPGHVMRQLIRWSCILGPGRASARFSAISGRLYLRLCTAVLKCRSYLDQEPVTPT